jgi:hypothetical protein
LAANDVAIRLESALKLGALTTTFQVLEVLLPETRGCRPGRTADSVFSPLNGKPRKFSSSPIVVSSARSTPISRKVPLFALKAIDSAS